MSFVSKYPPDILYAFIWTFTLFECSIFKSIGFIDQPSGGCLLAGLFTSHPTLEPILKVCIWTWRGVVEKQADHVPPRIPGFTRFAPAVDREGMLHCYNKLPLAPLN